MIKKPAYSGFFCFIPIALNSNAVLHEYVSLGLVNFMPARVCNANTDVDSLCQNPPLGLFSYPHTKSFRLYPNPGSDFTRIETDYHMHSAEIQVINNLGVKLRVHTGISGFEFLLERDELPNGIYFIQIIEKDKILGTARLVLTD